MEIDSETSDRGLLELLRRQGQLGIGELTAAMHVTATAVRQRLVRLMAGGLVQRETNKVSRVVRVIDIRSPTKGGVKSVQILPI